MNTIVGYLCVLTIFDRASKVTSQPRKAYADFVDQTRDLKIMLTT